MNRPATLCMLVALALALSCNAQDSAAPSGELEDMTGDPILDAIAELAPSDFEEIAALITSEGLAPNTYMEAQSPEAMEAVNMALSPFGINATAPGPDVESMIGALSPEDTLALVDDVSSILGAMGPVEIEEIIVTTAGRKMK